MSIDQIRWIIVNVCFFSAFTFGPKHGVTQRQFEVGHETAGHGWHFGAQLIVFRRHPDVEARGKNQN